ncbi:hypothetical protein LOZ60_006041 [Ophidiomyces ophidiicola]|nr:hypothetical protein LOZ60_006041 [Ophidiomyces ophidiicola]
MESNANEPTPSPSHNGLKLFPRPKRSRTALNEAENAHTHDGGSRGLTLNIRPSTISGASHEASPTALAKFIPGAKKRHRKKAKDSHDKNSTDQSAGLSGGSKVSLQRSEASAEHHGSDHTRASLTDDSESEVYSSRVSRADIDIARPPLITVSDSSILDGPHAVSSGSTVPGSDRATDSPTPSMVGSEHGGSQAGRSTTKGNGGSSTGRKLREAFNPRSSKGNSNASPDRESAKSTESQGSKGLSGTGGRKSSFSSKKSKNAPEDIPPVPVLQKHAENRPPTKPHPLPSADTTPSTPPSGTQNAPITTVTPPTPTDPRFRDVGARLVESPESSTNVSTLPPNVSTLPPNAVVSPSGNMISHRRVRSASAAHNPSKLSTSMTLPPTPGVDENKTPGSRATQGNFGTGAGFFSSMFSAAQNAASTLSIGLNQNRGRTATDPTEPDRQSLPERVEEESQSPQEDSKQKKELAVNTLGMGDLDFSHLGIESSPGGTMMTSDGLVFTRSDQIGRSKNAVSQQDELAARIEDLRAARAVSMAYEKQPTSTALPATIDEDNQTESRPSIPPAHIAKENADEQTTPAASIIDGEIPEHIKRSGSLRSRRAAHRQRGSSTATAATVGGIGNTLGATGSNSSVPRLTGFAVASKKRNRDFHQLFRSVPEDDYLIEDYSCALQREIILAGRIYISEGHICFSSNILGWVTTLVIGFDEIVAIEKESTAMVFPNAIAVQSLHARHTFRSLLSRDSTYDLMVNIWKINHPTLKSSVNGTQVDQGTGDKTEKTELSDGETVSLSDGEDVYDEDEEGDMASNTDAVASVAGSDISEPKRVIRKSSTMPLSALATSRPASIAETAEPKISEKPGNLQEPPAQFPGPKTHSPTEFTDPSGRYDRVVKDETIPAPLGHVYSLVFGPSSGSFISKFLLDHEKVIDLQFEDDKKGLTEENKTRSYSYIKPLNSSIGPKQTKCTTVEQLDFLDLEKAILVTLTTQTPDVPSGNVFSVKTKYLLTWAPGNSTRFFMSCNVEWTGKSWIKGPIEKGANDGQLGYGTNLIKVLKAGVAPKGRKSASKGIPKGKGKRVRTTMSGANLHDGDTSRAGKNSGGNWGLFEPLKGPLSPLVNLIRPIWSSNVAIIIGCCLLFVMWFRTPSSSSMSLHNVALHHLSVPERLLAYDELWAKEESELWSWLEERVGMDGFALPVANVGPSGSKKQQRKRHLKEAESRLRDEKMSEREITDAIRVTQQRLETLQRVIDKRKADRQQTGDQPRATK